MVAYAAHGALSSPQVNVQMVSLLEGTKILQRRTEEVELFYDTTGNGTWMSGFGILYLNQFGEQQSITIELNQTLARSGEYPFVLTFQGDTCAVSLCQHYL